MIQDGSQDDVRILKMKFHITHTVEHRVSEEL
jgi:hypothetical protein